MLSTSILYCNNIDSTSLQMSPNLNSRAFVSPMPLINHNKINNNNSNNNNSNNIINNNNHPQQQQQQKQQRSLSPHLRDHRPAPSITSSSQTILEKNLFRVRYFGSHRCDNHSVDKGIPQKALLDLYSSVMRRSMLMRSFLNGSAINQIAEISNHGIVVAENEHSKTTASPIEDRSTTVITKVITPLSNVVLFGAVKLRHRTLSAGRNGRLRNVGVAFVPISCSEAVLDKNCFIQLPTKQRFLLGLPHPPLFVCILRKVSASDRLECHLFVCHSTGEAVRMCEKMSQLRRNPGGTGGGIVGGIPSRNINKPTQASAGYHFKSARPSHRHRSGSSSLLSNHLALSSIPSSRASHRSYHSELSSRLSTTPRFMIESDIEEEDEHEFVDGERGIVNAQSGVRNVCSIDDMARISGMQQRFMPNDKLSVSSHYLYRPRLLKPMPDTMSWNDQLSSVSSAIFSIGSKQSSLATSSVAAATLAAGQDYRYRSYKFADDEFSISPSDISSKSMNSVETPPKPSSLIISKKPIQPLPPRPLSPLDCDDVHSNTNDPPWSSVSNELQHNRLFARASAKAALDERTHGRHNGQHTNDIEGRQRFFGDTLIRPFERDQSTLYEEDNEDDDDDNEGNTDVLNRDDAVDDGKHQKCYPKDQFNKRPTNTKELSINGGAFKSSSSSSSRIEQQKSKLAKLSQQFKHPFIEQELKQTAVQKTQSTNIHCNERLQEQQQQPSSNQCGAVKSQLNNYAHNYKSSPAVCEFISSQQQHRTSMASSGALSTKDNRNESILSATPNRSEVHGQHQQQTIESCSPVAPVAIYLPSNQKSSVGVKCFNKNSQVQQWSTMVPKSVIGCVDSSGSGGATAPLLSSAQQQQQQSSPSSVPIVVSSVNNMKSVNNTAIKSRSQNDEECSYCMAKFECHECCQLCVEHYNCGVSPMKNHNKQPSHTLPSFTQRNGDCCFDCAHDDIVDEDIVLDDVLKQFAKFNLNSISDVNNTANNPLRSTEYLSSQNKPVYSSKLSRQDYVTSGGRRDVSNVETIPKKSFLTKLKQFFGASSRGTKPTRSKLWSSIRSRSIRLRGSLRYKQRRNRNQASPTQVDRHNQQQRSQCPQQQQSLPKQADQQSSKQYQQHKSNSSFHHNHLTEPAADYITDYVSPPDEVKPFFIHHPAKDTIKDSDGNIISISSDSGMEEYEYHSGQ